MKYKCNKCKHEWRTRIDSKPISCPKCKRYDWGDKKNGNSTDTN